MSTVSIQEQMRALVDQYETGLLDQEDYRRLRSGLLDRAAKGEYDAPELSNLTRPREAARSKPVTETPAAPAAAKTPKSATPRATPEPAAEAHRAGSPQPDHEQPAPAGGAGKWVAAAALLALVAVAGWWFSSGGDAQPPPVVTETPSPQSPGAMEQVALGFMEVDDWTPGAIREFTLRWQDFTAQQRQQAQSSIWYRRFVRDLRDRLSLAELASDEVANDRAVAISTLAYEMGIDVESRFAESRDISAVKAAAIADNEAAAARQRRLSALPQSTDVKPAPESPEDAAAEETEQTGDSVPAQNAAVDAAVKTAPVTDNVKEREDAADDAEAADPAPPAIAEVAVAVQVDDASGAAAERADTPNVVAEQIADAEAATLDAPDASTAKNAETPAPAAAGGGCSKSLLSSRQRFCRDLMPDGSRGPRMALIRSGEFRMGSSADRSEQPVHTVRIANGFAIGVSEVSVAEFAAFCAATERTCPDNPWASDTLPVVNVSFDDAASYARWLSTRSGRPYRLPSEAEWEYATRAGSDTEYPFGDTLEPGQAHFSPLRRKSQPLPANSGRPAANAFGLKHAIGNVSEWVQDAWHDDYTGAPGDGSAFGSASGGQGVVRGGSYADTSAALRSAARGPMDADARNVRTGFRVVRELP